jgi:hypothetical protein
MIELQHECMLGIFGVGDDRLLSFYGNRWVDAEAEHLTLKKSRPIVNINHLVIK